MIAENIDISLSDIIKECPVPKLSGDERKSIIYNTF